MTAFRQGRGCAGVELMGAAANTLVQGVGGAGQQRQPGQFERGALAFIVWRLSLENAKELHREGFEYDSDRERVGMISEFCARPISRP